MHVFNDVNLYKFFDHFGLFIFSFLLIDALFDILKRKNVTWKTYVRAIIGVGGLLIDGFLVFFY